MTPKSDEFKVPESLMLKAAHAIIALLEAKGCLDSGGCKVFYSPEEWAERKEEYGKDALLIVVHDGGDHAGFFSLDYEQYNNVESMNKALAPLGLYAEQCTGWYSAVYKI